MVAMKKAAGLMTMQWIIRRIQVQPELAWRLVVSIKAHLDQQTVQGIRSAAIFW